jgi:hypothetical protein
MIIDNNQHKLPERGRRGGKKILEFSAVTDQGEKAKTRCTVKAQHLNKIMISYYYDMYGNLSAGGLWRQVPPAFLTLHWPSQADFTLFDHLTKSKCYCHIHWNSIPCFYIASYIQ